ncbi:MAG TPA: CapA family protein [Candidatus Acidoferrales bacterium]|nr:CapA family protein [Candidatus Acidoferrales bacterium]
MHLAGVRRAVALLAVGGLVGACLQPSPSPSSSPVAIAPTPGATTSPEPSPSPTAVPAATAFPLAVVTGLTSLKPATTVAEVQALASSGRLVVPCGVEVTAPVVNATAPCQPADRIATAIEANPALVALLPPGLVEPATRILPVGGDGPFGLFGADLFGDPAARALPYPITGRATGEPGLAPAWLAYDPASVWTIASVGGSCPDAGAAYQATTLGKGWDWVFDGGTARYRGKPYLNPNPPAGVSRELIVSPVDTGHAGVVPRLIAGADLTIADVECPIVPASSWTPNYGGKVLQFSISSDVLPLWRDKLGFDLLYMAANHNSDKGLFGIKSSLRLLDGVGIEHTGLGLALDQALEPAYVERAGVRIAFVAWNIVPGVTRADADTAGVAWLTKANVIEGVRRARAGGAQLVICDPQWWGGAEYHSDFKPGQYTELAWFDEAGCDDVIGAGTHLAGPMLLRGGVAADGGPGVVMASEGNVMFGQGWWQQTQEGVFMRLAFRGTTLVNVRLDPYVMLFNSRASLTDPQGDGHYVLERVWKNSTVDYLP